MNLLLQTERLFTVKDKIIAFEIVLARLETSLLAIADFDIKATETSWSKKEILGHLVDSAINNLQRFTEIQHAAEPYRIRPYNQDELVKANCYQHKNTQDLITLLIALNRHIIYLVKNQTAVTLKYPIVLPNKTVTDLAFVIEDYFVHFYHHLNQITNK
ncbi:DinB family protein [Flavobacterium paronense]|uniref:DinB family protein n=1 Tax=Flavobacterium paronense TaxID=1392775 RepID=A0ABV5GGJ5_9FLAO|nr:DinB family protein [Flavobacterium paronense]MDN3677097.1 DinB family protein [Flavobacterium paronense]